MSKEYTNGIHWKDIPGYEGIYAISDDGKVYSYPKRHRNAAGYYIQPSRILKLSNDKDGYPFAILYKDGNKSTHKVHQLVASAFIPNTNSKLTDIDHINNIKDDNRVCNLKWCTHRYNIKKLNLGNRNYSTKKKKVLAISLKDKMRFEFNSIRDAERKLKISAGLICKCAKGNRKQTNGYVFKYVET
ncbi:NUMOD4 domain-containing protein [Liquorilactobacillus mali]|uniref:NUMOD4 domain-containing protein n=1 Tax=Liquorilactobacillus mali TaxID=1618 RepID=UPI0023507C13|nr:NUMOD4 domain-containing protein [Liquorilactobacillus mali]MDC7953589.1 HNH endonuclease [Liquorilactobacillus mali]